MPSPHTSQNSLDDAHALAKNLGIRTVTLPIASLMAELENSLATLFVGRDADITEENIQARIRGNLLMAISNKFGALLLATGNKSELAVGYCTIYGDMAGGLAVISDVPKTLVYRICHWLNATLGCERGGEIIPTAIIEKPPTAELRPGQTDQDSLPPYDVLDDILRLLIEEHRSPQEIVRKGHTAEIVERVTHLIESAEFKRRQAAPGIVISDQAFGIGRRLPIATLPRARRRTD